MGRLGACAWAALFIGKGECARYGNKHSLAVVALTYGV
jgi:hypothetical protein